MLTAILLLALVPNVAPSAHKTPDATRRCCLTNSAYRGVCVVTLGEKESCEDVLAYLNAPNTAGRTYCNSTRLRGGWEELPCPPATPLPAAAAPAAGAVTGSAASR